jgi:hypothetical protein
LYPSVIIMIIHSFYIQRLVIVGTAPTALPPDFRR